MVLGALSHRSTCDVDTLDAISTASQLGVAKRQHDAAGGKLIANTFELYHREFKRQAMFDFEFASRSILQIVLIDDGVSIWAQCHHVAIHSSLQHVGYFVLRQVFFSVAYSLAS